MINNQEKTSLREAVSVVRKKQMDITNINDPKYGQLDEVIYTLLDIIEGDL